LPQPVMRATRADCGMIFLLLLTGFADWAPLAYM
jgi:hypothetical protein